MTWYLACDRCGVMGMLDRPVADDGWIELDDKSHLCVECRAKDMLTRATHQPTSSERNG